MSPEPQSDNEPQSEWARKCAAAKIRRQAQRARQAAYFDLLVSGYSVAEIARETKTSTATVRRVVKQALARRQVDSREDFVRLQLARLNKALACADRGVEASNLQAIGPFLAVVAELNRFYGLGPSAPLRLRPAPADDTARPARSLPPPQAGPTREAPLERMHCMLEAPSS